MKKLLSVFLAIMIMVTSCICCLTVFAAEPCRDHIVETWSNNNTKNHVGICTVCEKQVKEAHILLADNTVAPTCTSDGYTFYKCKCGYHETRDIVKSKGHDIISVTYDYDQEKDGVFNELDIKYAKTIVCRNNCAPKIEYGNIGNSNYCPECGKYTLLSKTEVNATCKSTDYVEYNCSNPDCDGVFIRYGKDLKDCEYTAVVTEPTCSDEGYTTYTCKYDNTHTYKDNYIPAKGHKLNRAGETTTYVYHDGKCTITGYCSQCDEESSIQIEEPYATAETCTCGCEKAIVQKTVTFPSSCEDSITITTECNVSRPQTIEAVPVGHSFKTATYEYHDNGELKSAIAECYDCGTKEIKEDEYTTANTCVLCSSIIEKRVIVAPTCSANGYTRVTCPECGEYTESTKGMLSHNGNVAEWKFDREAGTYTFSSNCTNDGCGGYTFDAAIGTAGKCTRCGRDALTYKKIVYSDCLANGYTTAKCSYCLDYSGYDIKTTLPHDNVSVNVEADCENGGYLKSTCKTCYYTVKTNETAPLGHIGGVETITYDGTNKTTLGFCNRCNREYTETEAIPAGEDTCKNGRRNCITEKQVVKPDCSKETDGYTRVHCKCEYYHTDIVKYKHDYGAWTIVLAPTCVEAGLRERTCSVCSAVEKDTIPADQTVTGDPKHKYVVMVSGYPATCTEPGLSDERYCSSCGDYQRAKVIPALGHTFDPGSTNKDFCNRCDSYVIGDGAEAVACSCMCHNRDGLAKFFFKIILFFCQILNINKTCDCGTIHY